MKLVGVQCGRIGDGRGAGGDPVRRALGRLAGRLSPGRQRRHAGSVSGGRDTDGRSVETASGARLLEPATIRFLLQRMLQRNTVAALPLHVRQGRLLT